MLRIRNGYERPIELQRILEASIAALKPRARDATNQRQWHLYEVLEYRYLQQFSQREVADQLNVSVRQLARDQDAALQALALHLWDRYDLDTNVTADRAGTTGDATEGDADDLAWLAVPSPDRMANAAQCLHEVVAMIKPLAESYQVVLDVEAEPKLPTLATYPTAVRQILLSLLTVALHAATGAHLLVSAQRAGQDVSFLISGPAALGQALREGPDPEPELEIARRMAELCGGTLALETGRPRQAEGTATARLSLPILGSVPILVVDDSADHIELLSRYTAHTRYRVVGTQEPDRAPEIAQEVDPRAVLVDIMMPFYDGWTVIQRLRAHPGTSDLPVVVCSIIPCAELALSLGADACLLKPIGQEQLLAVLDRWTGAQGSRPR